MPPLGDPRALERFQAQMGRMLGQMSFDDAKQLDLFLAQRMDVDALANAPAPETPLDRAQERMYDAWGAEGARRVELAREALEISADCADAYVMFAEELATTGDEALPYYEQGVAAGKHALGPAPFAESVGDFWGILETRPYMRALEGRATALVAVGRMDDAIADYEELLRLNPNDNQGCRYSLARTLLLAGANARLGQLLDRYPDDETTEWLHVRALHVYRAEGPTERAAELLCNAIASNVLVPAILLGAIELPEATRPADIPAGFEEAALVALHVGMAWLVDEPSTLFMAETMEGYLDTLTSKVRRPKTVPGQRPALRARRGTDSGRIFQIKITLQNVRPPVWRRLLVPADTPLDRLHDIVQAAMGWTDSHLHAFRAGTRQFGADDNELEMESERKFTLGQLARRAKSKFHYDYDFGDGWRHEILVEEIHLPVPETVYPVCVGGKRACPPEDCGGPWGYGHLLELLANPDAPDPDDMRDWLGEEFDPAAFDLVEVNDRLKRI